MNFHWQHLPAHNSAPYCIYQRRHKGGKYASSRQISCFELTPSSVIASSNLVGVLAIGRCRVFVNCLSFFVRRPELQPEPRGVVPGVLQPAGLRGRRTHPEAPRAMAHRGRRRPCHCELCFQLNFN